MNKAASCDERRGPTPVLWACPTGWRKARRKVDNEKRCRESSQGYSFKQFIVFIDVCVRE
jgi:hypothetical protein